ncbi:RimJ/RimL family protein N-acetyltransferase [Streptacidiphilus sp. MAP12-16]|uniref:GNAT family N-acetyltransferase n=1 Tax=Streptacidiphilus sp. MAP12-16 TaxID=3156300 RepID=UPI003518AF06
MTIRPTSSDRVSALPLFPSLPALPASPFSLAGAGLVLRDWTDDDLPAMVELFDEAEVARWTPLPSPFDLEAARRYLARARDARGEGRRIQLAVTTDGGAPLGEVLAMPRGDGREVELGYAIGAAHRRRGLSSRTVRLVTGFAYDVLGSRRILLRIAPDNEASCAVARSAGFQVTDAPPDVVETPDGSRQTLRFWEHRRGGAAPRPRRG